MRSTMKMVVLFCAALIGTLTVSLGASAQTASAYGDWRLLCGPQDFAGMGNCMIGQQSFFAAGGPKPGDVLVIYFPQKKTLAVGIANETFTATARIDGKPAQNGKPGPDKDVVLFDGDFDAALRAGSSLTVELTVAGKPPKTVTYDLADFKKAVAAAPAP